MRIRRRTAIESDGSAWRQASDDRGFALEGEVHGVDEALSGGGDVALLQQAVDLLGVLRDVIPAVFTRQAAGAFVNKGIFV